MSANGKYRLTVEPSPIWSQLEYYREEAKAIERGEKVERPSPTGLFEMRDSGGTWTTLWFEPLANHVAPVDALIADDGSHVLTFDNWGSIGRGDDVIVIYDHAGMIVRSMKLTDLVPESYVDALPHSVSSLSWKGGMHFSADRKAVELDVLVPGVDPDADAQTVRFQVLLSDGTVIAPPADRWQMALSAAAEVNERIKRVEEARIAYFTNPLAIPRSQDEPDWHQYLLEAFLRLTPDYLDEPSTSTTVLFPPEHARFKESIKWLVDEFKDAADFPGNISVASPQSQNGLIVALKKATAKVHPGALKGSVVYVSVDEAHRALAEGLVRTTGAEFVWLDPAATILQRAERVPGSPEKAAADKEIMRRMMAGLDEDLEVSGAH